MTVVLEDKLSLYRGDSYKVTDKLIVHQPTLGEICDIGENEYLKTLGMVLAHPFEMIVQLDKMGIDFTEISEFELFAMLCKSFTGTAITLLFDDVDFSSMCTYTLKDTNEMILANKDGVIINQYNYKMMCAFLRTIHNFSTPKYQTIANEYSKKMAIEEAYDNLRYASTKKKSKSLFMPLVSSLVNYSGFKYDSSSVWNLKMYQFFDAVKRIQAYENASHQYIGLYMGSIDFNKIKQDLDWMKDFT